jgi:hypothetical protein
MSAFIDSLQSVAVLLLIAALPITCAAIVLQIQFKVFLEKNHSGYIEANAPQVASVFKAHSPLSRRVLLSGCYRELKDAELNRLGAWARNTERAATLVLWGAIAAAFGPAIVRNVLT